MPEILAVLLWIGAAVGIGWILCKVMSGKRLVCHQPLTLALSGAMALALYFRFCLTVTAVQGMFLWFALLYGSMSDLTDHTMPDSVWVIVLALAIPSITKNGIVSMLTGAVCVMLPQLALAVIPPHRTLGGAEIKLSGALAVLLGFTGGLTAFLAGLLMAVVTVTVRDFVQTRLHKRRDCPKKPFALIPFLAVGGMVMFLVGYKIKNADEKHRITSGAFCRRKGRKHEEKEIHRVPLDWKPDGDRNRLHDSGNRNLLWHCPDRAKVICGKDENLTHDANRSARELPDRGGCGNG